MKSQKKGKLWFVVVAILLVMGLGIASNVNIITEWYMGNVEPSLTLLFPLDDDEINVNTTEFNWTSSDANGDPITHVWYLDKLDTFTSPFLRSVNVSEDQNYTPNPMDDGDWYWRVEASDGQEYNVSETRHLVVKVNVTNNFPNLTSPDVTPLSGHQATIFYYTVNFSDADNDTANYIYVVIDGTNYTMNETNISDTNTVDGKQYIYNTTLAYGFHNYSMICSDGHASNSTDVFDYPSVFYVGQTPPAQSNPSPANESEQVIIPISNFSISIADTDGQNMNISLWTNESGSWVLFNSSVNLTNGTYHFTNTAWADGLGTIYYWRVCLTDSIFWVNETYWFYTETIDVIPVYPENNSVVSPQPYLVFELVTPTGDTMNYTVYVGNSSVNTTTVLASASGVGNATYNHLYVLAVNNSEDYYWRVYAYDDTLFVNETFNFGVSTSMGGFLVMSNSFAFVLALGGWIFGVAGLIFALMVYTNKGKGKGRGKKKPRKFTGRVRGF